MSYTVTTMKARILATLPTGPYTSDAAYETKIENAIKDTFNYLLLTMSWWFARNNVTVPDVSTGSMPDKLDALFYLGSAAEGFVISNCPQQAEICEKLFQSRLVMFQNMYRRTPQ